jgi:hypothetical protein
MQPALNVLCQNRRAADHDGGPMAADRGSHGATDCAMARRAKGAGRAHDLVERAAALEEVDKRNRSSPFRPDAFPVAQGRAPGRERQDSGYRDGRRICTGMRTMAGRRAISSSPSVRAIRDGDDEAARDSRPISRA